MSKKKTQQSPDGFAASITLRNGRVIHAKDYGLSVIVARSCYAARDALNGFLIKMFHFLGALPLCLYLLYYKISHKTNFVSDV